jgi:hypothetical protein
MSCQSAVAWVQLFLNSSLLKRDDPPKVMQSLLMAAIAPASIPPPKPKVSLAIQPLDFQGARKGPVNEGWNNMVSPSLNDLSRRLLAGSQLVAQVAGGGAVDAALTTALMGLGMPPPPPPAAAQEMGVAKRRKIGQGSHKFDLLAESRPFAAGTNRAMIPPQQGAGSMPLWPWQGL